MKNPIQAIIDQQGFLVLDGALATELEARGAELNDPLWSAKILMEAPELIRAVHLDYLRAGADIITTSTYQATLEGFARKGIKKNETISLFKASVDLAIEARTAFWTNTENQKNRYFPLVAASIGPYGAFLADGSEYNGHYGLSVQELTEFHYPRMEILADTKADLLAFETIPCLKEAEAIIRLMERFPQAVAMLSFSCKDGKHLSNGDLFSDGIKLTNSSDQIIAAGVNCTAPQFILPLLGSVEQLSRKPLLVYPNSGEQWDAQRHCWLPGKGEKHWLESLELWYKAGARLIGGCCRTNPGDIHHLRQQLRNFSSLSNPTI